MEINKNKLLLILSKILEANESSSESEEDDYFDEINAVTEILTKNIKPKSYVENYIDVIHTKTEEQFKRQFKMKRATVQKLQQKFIESNFFKNRLHSGGTRQIPGENYAYIFLQFVGNKISLREISKLYSIGVASVCKIVHQFCDFLVDILPEYIKFPDTVEEKKNIAKSFHEISDFPNCLGCIATSYIRVPSPITPRDYIFITLQAICDADLKFLDIFTAKPSKNQDSTVYKESTISDQLQRLCAGKYYILGNPVYPLREWILTPIKKYTKFEKAEQAYNKKFIPTQLKIKDAFSALSSRFLQLQQLSFRSTDMMTNIIIACCVLHNICIIEKDELEDSISTTKETVQNFILQSESEDRHFFETTMKDRELERLGRLKRDEIVKSFIRNDFYKLF